MRREKRYFDFPTFDSGHDYKTEYIEEKIRRNCESVDKWLYLGADSLDDKFGKIGVTMGDLASRSYSSSRPSYYLFCAFKCIEDISSSDVKRIENDVISRIDSQHRNPDGSSKRLKHFESGALSECFWPIDFLQLYRDVHDSIYDHHRNYFVISGWENSFGDDDGGFVDCIFNPKLNQFNQQYIKMILRFD